MSCTSRMNQALQCPVKLLLDRESKHIIFSDCHRGQGNANDNFLKNQNLYFSALEYYEQLGFHYIELGDGEELWENRNIEDIKECYRHIYWKFDCFKMNQKMTKIYGNHDHELREECHDSVLLCNREGGRDIAMVHGHQADFFNSVCWRLARFLVRYLWQPLEYFGVNNPTNAAKNNKKVMNYEHCMEKYANDHQIYLLAGHSHRPYLKKDELYLNAGSCIHPRCITGIEVTNMQLTLVKWAIATHPDRTLYVQRKELAGPFMIH